MYVDHSGINCSLKSSIIKKLIPLMTLFWMREAFHARHMPDDFINKFFHKFQVEKEFSLTYKLMYAYNLFIVHLIAVFSFLKDKETQETKAAS